VNTVVKRPDSTPVRDAIFRAEDWILEQPQADIETVHRFAPGVYTREMIVPANVMLTGAIHKTEHISIFLSGTMLVPDESGQTKKITAPIVELAKPGIKRLGFTLEEVRWITVHPTEMTDVEQIEAEFFTNDPAEIDALLEHNDSAMISMDLEDETP